MRRSGVSSGWNAVASAGPWRTATILPVRDSVPMISTPGPACSTQGALMNTARKSGPGMPLSAMSLSNESTWRPNAFRRTVMSIPPTVSCPSVPSARRSASMIIPAQEPNAGMPELSRLRSGSIRSKITASFHIVVDSPPGITSPSTPSSSPGLRTGTGREPAARSAARCSATSPCSASTPMAGPGAEATVRGASRGSVTSITPGTDGFDPRLAASRQSDHPPRSSLGRWMGKHTAMTHAWTPSGGPPMIGRPGSGLITLLEETAFCICESAGDIQPGGAQGLFFRDTRFISRLELRLDREPPEPGAVQPPEPFACTFLSHRPGVGLADSTLLVIRRRYVGNGMRDDITLRNLGREPAAAHLTVAVDSDFADLFEVKEERARPRGDEDEVEDGAEGGALRLRCRRGANVGAVSVTGPGGPAASPGLLTWQVVIPHRASWTATVLVTPSLDGQEAAAYYSDSEPVERTAPARRLADWRRRSPVLISSDERLVATFATSAEDVGSRRIFGHSP